MNFPKHYEWLANVGTLPRTIQEALKLYGQRETPDPHTNNPMIMEWVKEVNVNGFVGDSETAWCGLFAAVVVKRAGKPVVDQPLWAANWGKFGVEVPYPGLGDILVFVRPGGGHVGFYIAEDNAAYHVIGGNQANMVSITRIAKDRCTHKRRPQWATAQPKSVRPYYVKATGVLSKNEE